VPQWLFNCQEKSDQKCIPINTVGIEEKILILLEPSWGRSIYFSK
jgi:hypothetical protein